MENLFGFYYRFHTPIMYATVLLPISFGRRFTSHKFMGRLRVTFDTVYFNYGFNYYRFRIGLVTVFPADSIAFWTYVFGGVGRIHLGRN